MARSELTAFPPVALPLPFQLFTAPERQAGLTAAFLSRPAQSGDCPTASPHDGEQLWRADFLEEARTQSMTLALILTPLRIDIEEFMFM